MRLTEPGRRRGGRGPVLEGLHPRDRARSSARRRSSSSTSFIAPTFQALVDGASYVDERLRRDHRGAPARRDRRGQRRRLPGPAGQRPAVGADRLLQPGRGEGPRRRADVLAATRTPTARAGTSSGPSIGETHDGMHADFDAFCRERGAPPLPELRVHPRVAVAEPLPLPDEVDYARARPARRQLAQPAGERARDRRRAGRCPSRSPAARAPLVYLSLGSLGIGRPVELMQGSDHVARRRAATA